MTDKTKISVVTVCYNAATAIEETIQSIINQTYSNIEYIIIDGGSKDGTVDIIKKYADKIAYWVSEPDKGIYDAMNKGIDVATGEWINFMNAGDTFYNNGTIESVSQHIEEGIDVIYGNIELKYSWGAVERKALPLNVMNKRFPLFHPSSYVRIGKMKELKFDTSYKICADYNLFYQLYYQQQVAFYYLNQILSVFEAETGVSSVNYLKMKKEDGRLQNKNHLISWKIEYFFLSVYFKLSSIVKRLIPLKMLVGYHRYRYLNS
ncbi:glycosyltransferase family 2 protein [Phocaeicola sp.]